MMKKPIEIVEENKTCPMCSAALGTNDFCFGADIGFDGDSIRLSCRRTYTDPGLDIDFTVNALTGEVEIANSSDESNITNSLCNVSLTCGSCERWCKIFSFKTKRSGKRLIAGLVATAEYIDIDYNKEIFRVTKDFLRQKVTMMPLFTRERTVKATVLSSKFISVTNYDNLSKRIKSLLVLSE